jgi:adenosylcobinamide-GDP ribazoletransferase
MLTEPLPEAKPSQPREKMAWLRPLVSLAAAVQFLTIVPPLVRRPFRDDEMGGAVAWFPAVGLAIGGVLLGAHALLAMILPPPLVAALALTLWVLLTGAIHLDGFLDTCDGLFGGRTPEDRLRIMRDERVGAYAVSGGVLLVLLKFQAIVSLPSATTGLLLAPALGRLAIAVAIVAFPYAREFGLGRSMKDHAGWGALAFAGSVALAAAWCLAGPVGLFGAAAVAVLALLAGVFTCRRLPGLTGDIYGAIAEIAEVLALLVLLVGGRA